MDWQNNRVDTGVHLNQTSAPRTGGASVGARRNPSQTASGAVTLSEGQVVRGEVINLTNQEATIELEDHTQIHAQIQDSSQLSIGQTAAFRVSEVSQRRVVLEKVPQSSANEASQTILKALDEANLPKNEKNIEIVKQLLKQQLSISRGSINSILQQSYQNPDVSIATLVSMNRQQMKVTEVNARMLEQYRTGTQSMMRDIEALSEELPALLDLLSENAPEGTVARFGQALLSQIGEIPSNGMPANEVDCSMLSTQERVELSNLLFTNAEDATTWLEKGLTKEAILDGTAKLSLVREAYLMVTNNLTEGYNAEALLNSSLEIEPLASENDVKSGILRSLGGLWEQLKQGLGEKTTEIGENSNSSLATHLEQSYQTAQLGNHELGRFLNQGELTSFKELLEKMQISESFGQQVADGDASLQSVLKQIQTQLANPQNVAAAKELFQSGVFQKVLKESVAASWTLTPQALGKKEQVDRLYPKMEQQVTGLKNLIQQNLSGEDADHMAKQTQDMKDHIDFMKSLNEMFSYIQLPVKTTNGLVHSDLYVYTKKNRQTEQKGKVSALLQLDLEALGKLDIQVELEYNMAKVTFYTQEESTYHLLSRNMGVLQDAINDKGYSLDGRVEKSSSLAQPIDELFEQRIPAGSVKRYSFDIRA